MGYTPPVKAKKHTWGQSSVNPSNLVKTSTSTSTINQSRYGVNNDNRNKITNNINTTDLHTNYKDIPNPLEVKEAYAENDPVVDLHQQMPHLTNPQNDTRTGAEKLDDAAPHIKDIPTYQSSPTVTSYYEGERIDSQMATQAKIEGTRSQYPETYDPLSHNQNSWMLVQKEKWAKNSALAGYDMSLGHDLRAFETNKQGQYIDQQGNLRGDSWNPEKNDYDEYHGEKFTTSAGAIVGIPHHSIDGRGKQTTSWTGGGEFFISPGNAGADHKQILSSQSSARNYNNIIADWQSKFLRRADSSTVGEINAFKAKTIAKIDKWKEQGKITPKEAKMYKDDIKLRAKQLKTTLGKSIPRVDQLKDYREGGRIGKQLAPGVANKAVQLFQGGRPMVTKDGKVRPLTWKDLSAGY